MPGPCNCSGLSVASCLRQLCPLGTRSLSAQASVCGSPFGAVLEHGVSGVAQLPTGRSARLPPSLRVALGCAQGPTGATLPFGTVRFARPSGKKASIAHFAGGAHNVARNGVRQLPPSLGARSCSPISAVKMEGPFSLRCLSPLCPGAAGVKQAQPTQVGMLHCSLDNFAAQKTVLFFSSAVGTIHT